MTELPHARLHVLLASAAPFGVIIRRGPANAVCTIGWNRETNEFTLGQWLRGRIYERRSDLSPDGRYLIYFARGGRRHVETRGSWTAVSRAPWLHAFNLYGKGDCWQGGGLFTSRDRFWLNGCHSVVREIPDVLIDPAYRPQGGFGAECPSVYYPRLLRDGWIIEARIKSAAVADITVFSKPLLHGWVVRKYANADANHPPGSGPYWDEHELENPNGRVILSKPAWDWAERDGSGLVWTENGVLYRAAIDSAGLTPATVLHDFNGMRFENRRAPY